MTDFLWIAVIATLAIIAVGGFAVDHLLKLLRRRQAVQRRIEAMTPAYSICCGCVCKPIGWSADGWIASCRSCGAIQYLGDDHENPPGGFEITGKARIGFHAGGVVKASEPRRDRVIGKHPSLGAPYGFADGGYVSPTGRRPSDPEMQRLPLPGEHLISREAAERMRDNFRRRFGSLWPTQDEAHAARARANHSAEVTSDEPYYPVGKARIQAELTYRLGIDEGEPLATPPLPNIGGEGHPEYKGPHYESDEVPQFIPYDMKLNNPNRPDGVAVMPAKGKDDGDDIPPA